MSGCPLHGTKAVHCKALRQPPAPAPAAQQRVHSFDLVAAAPGVVACNMAAVPLPDAAVDAAIFCLSLMGTDYGAFLQARPLSALCCLPLASSRTPPCAAAAVQGPP